MSKLELLFSLNLNGIWNGITFGNICSESIILVALKKNKELTLHCYRVFFSVFFTANYFIYY